jgi:hypothetical protein
MLTEVFRAGPVAAARGPLGEFRHRPASADRLLHLVPAAALSQLAEFRRVFDTMLIPQLSSRHGLWCLGPTFAGSHLLNADADLIAAGLLADLKTSAKKPSLGRDDLYQVIGYALLDFDDAYQLTDLGIFSARYAYLATWDLRTMLDELAGRSVSLADTREEFRQLLLTR